jgi:pimeloyl-ACP methyl ester carboxylesterase
MRAPALSYGLSRVVNGETDLLVTQRDGARGRCGVVLCHGANGTAGDWINAAGSAKAASTLAAAGFTMVAADLGGVQTYGNDTAVAAVEAARLLLVSLGCGPKVALLGGSMGNLTSFAYARAYPTRVAGIIGVMPASDINDLRDNDRLGSRSLIDTAWGVTYPSALPTRAVPLDPANLALTAGIGYHAYYSTADTVVIPSTVTALAAATGGTAHVVSSSQDHSDTLMGLPDYAAIAAVLASWGA